MLFNKSDEDRLLRAFLLCLLITQTPMEAAERDEVARDATLFWSVNEPNIRERYPDGVRTFSGVFNQFKALKSGEKAIRMTLLFVNL